MPPPDAAASLDAGQPPYHHSAAIAEKFGEVAWYASKSFWTAVGKYGIATPLLVWGLVWMGNGITKIVTWSGDHVFEPVVTNHSEFLAKTVANQETGNKNAAAIVEAVVINTSTLKEMKSEMEVGNVERKKMRIVLERLDRFLETGVPHRARSDDQGNAELPASAPPGLTQPCE